MPREPKQRGIDTPNKDIGGMGILYNTMTPYNIPQFTDGNMWRYLAGRQPVVQACITTLTMYAQSLPWDVRAVKPDKNDELQEDIDYHKQIFKAGGNKKHLNHVALILDDYYSIPFGSGTEAVRYSDRRLFKIVRIDGTTLFPTNNSSFPVMQKVGANEPVFYKPDELIRMYQFPRPELEREGWGMTPTERVYLAVELLARGDKYYAQLLLDTPEAGLLDLGDMSKESAEKWLDSFKNMMTGIDAFKIPVLYQHTVAAKFIPFGRPPTELLFDSITYKYASLICAAFGLTAGDIGLKSESGGGSLSGQMRDERHSKSTGYASLKAHLVEYYNEFLPDELEFVFIDTDDENLVAKGRARSTNAVAGRNLIESGAITPNEWRAQLKADGLMTIPLKEIPDESEFDILKEIDGSADQLKIQEEQLKLQKTQANAANKLGASVGGKGGLNKQRNVRGGKLEQVQGKTPKPASQGGQGEVKSEVEKAAFDGRNDLQKYLDESFEEIRSNITATRTRRLIKSALKQNFSVMSMVDADFEVWKDNYLQVLFDQNTDETIKPVIDEHLLTFADTINKDRWWEVEFDTTELAGILAIFYANGLEDAANEIQESLYEDGLVDRPNVNKQFTIKNEGLLGELDEYAIILALFVNSGTDYFIKRLSLGTVAEVANFPEYQEKLKSGTLEDLLNDNVFINTASDILATNLDNVLSGRIRTIADLENLKMYNKGVLRQYAHVGIDKKTLLHLGTDDSCELCKEAENLGYVPLDYKYTNKFGAETEVPPLHLNCNHVLTFSKSNLGNIRNNYMNGE